jgi:hypothetical protein
MTEQQATDIANALRNAFNGDVEVEKVNPAGRYRFAVVSDRFENVSHLRRQDQIWEVVDQTLPRDLKLDISLILAFTRNELAATE